MAQVERPILSGLARLGVPLGERGGSLVPLKEGLLARGFPLPDNEIFWNWRRLAEGKEVNKNGDRYARKIAVYEVLQTGKCERKVAFLSDLVETGIWLRTVQKSLPHRFDSEGLVGAIANGFNLDEQYLRKVFRGLRAEMALEDLENRDERLSRSFRIMAAEYFRAYTDSDLNYPSRVVRFVEETEKGWRGGLADFYKRLYRRASGRGGGGFFSYELSVMREHLHRLQDRGFSLSKMDARILHRYWKFSGAGELPEMLRQKTGVRVDKHVLAIWRNLLVG